MLPFRVYDRENKVTWVVLNYHAAEKGGSYLAAREDDSSMDGELCLLTVQEIAKFRMVGFVEDQE